MHTRGDRSIVPAKHDKCEHSNCDQNKSTLQSISIGGATVSGAGWRASGGRLRRRSGRARRRRRAARELRLGPARGTGSETTPRAPGGLPRRTCLRPRGARNEALRMLLKFTTTATIGCLFDESSPYYVL